MRIFRVKMYHARYELLVFINGFEYSFSITNWTIENLSQITQGIVLLAVINQCIFIAAKLR